MARSDGTPQGFEVFRGKGSVRPDSARVTIQTKGVFGLNLASFELLGRPEAVEFLFNSAERIIGLRRADPTSPHTYEVHSASTGNSFTVSGKAFLKSHGIPFESSVRYAARLEQGILIVDLKEEGMSALRRAPRIVTSTTTGGRPDAAV